jgi:hypothetical protein
MTLELGNQLDPNGLSVFTDVEVVPFDFRDLPSLSKGQRLPTAIDKSVLNTKKVYQV